MKKSLRHIVLILSVLLCSFSVQAQEDNLEKASGMYSHYSYINAIRIYKYVADKGYESPELYKKIADSYYFNAKYKKALKWYEKLFALDKKGSPPPLYSLRYSQSLLANGQKEKAKKFYNQYVKNSGKKLGRKKLTAQDYLQFIETNSGRYKIKALSKINTEGIDFGATIFKDKLVYASTRETTPFTDRKSGWDGLNFLNLFMVKLKGDSIVGSLEEFPGDINSKFHESSPIFTNDGETMYFTRSNFTAENEDENDKLKIYRAHFVEGEWQNIEDLSINSDSFSTAHPALSPNGEKLYFVSDRPGGYGQSDLYVVPIKENGELGIPKNLGPKINTTGRETFPFISQNHELYFSSNGHFGLGGLDIFYVKIKPSGFGHLLNIGKPINSFADDFAFRINDSTQRGFFSSNRGDSLYSFTRDNIYRLKRKEPIKKVYKAEIHGVVTRKETGEPLANVTIKLFTKEGELYKTIKTDSSGHYTLKTDYFTAYRIRVHKENFTSAEKVSQAKRREQEINFQLDQISLGLEPGTDLAKALNIRPIFFDLDESYIRENAEVELAKIITVMEENPKLEIEIRSHTDSRASDVYNMALSKRRAMSTLHYLIEHGISKDRLTAKWFGETRLVNGCDDGVPCTKAEHQANRRSEFIVVE